MSSTVYWQQVTPDKPLGACQALKHLLPVEGNEPGQKVIVRSDTRDAAYLKGYLDGLPEAHMSRQPLAEFLEDLRVHGELEVWIGE